MALELEQGRFHGQTIRTLEAGAFIFSESTYQPESRLPKHCHQNAYFSFLLGGFYREQYSRGSRECAPSMVVLHSAGEEHSDHFFKLW
jgi:hypothetical protein